VNIEKPLPEGLEGQWLVRKTHDFGMIGRHHVLGIVVDLSPSMPINLGVTSDPSLVPLLILHSSFCAYLDPNAGGWLFQLLFPVVVAIGGAWIILRRRIKGLWTRLCRRDKGKKEHSE